MKIAAAFNVEISKATQAVYLERLRKLSGQQMSTAGERTIEEWGKPGLMPPLSFILERCWAPVEHKPFQGFKALANQSRIDRAEWHEWLQAGKEAQQERIAKLHDDPKWRAEARRLGARG